MSSLLVPSSTSSKRCSVTGPSATNSKLSTIDFKSSRSMLFFLGVFDGNHSGLIDTYCRFNDDRSGCFFLENSYGASFDELEHRQKGHHDFHPRFDLAEERFEKHFPVSAQRIQQQGHFFPNCDLFQGNFVDIVFGQAVENAPQRRQEFKYGYCAKPGRRSFFDGRYEPDTQDPRENFSLFELIGCFLETLVLERSA